MDGSTIPRLIPGATINFGDGRRSATEADVHAWNRAAARVVALAAKAQEAKARTRARGPATTVSSPARARAPRGRRATTRAASAHGPPSSDDEPGEPDLARRALIGGAV